MTRHVVACALVAATMVAAAASQTFAQSKPDLAQSKSEGHLPPDYVIGPLDVVEVLFWKDKDLSAEVVVRPDGKISLPLLNEIDAGGLTPEQLRFSVLESARRFVEEPTATVIVKQINSRSVFIMGEVLKPGTYPLGGPTSVLQLIAVAGGLSEFASRDGIVVLRTVAGETQRFRVNYNDVLNGKDLKQNLQLRPGDTVVVP
jgi:polysaccharide biosynthesis/export protein